MKFQIRDVHSDEFDALGSLMVDVYSTLEGFPKPGDQPEYYEKLKQIGRFSEQPGARVLIAHSQDHGLLGGIVYLSDMAHYASGGRATLEKHASGIRLICVRHDIRGAGVGKALASRCIELARDSGNEQVILHSTQAMKVAWRMYENLGFSRSEDLDFKQGDLSVYGFRYYF